MNNYIPSEEDINEIFCPVVDIFNIKNREYVEVELNGQQIKVINGLPINLYLDNRCNSNCPFCINKGKEVAIPNFTKRTDKVISTEEFIQKFDNFYDGLLKNMDVKPALTITGGEPTISPRFIPFVQHLLKRKICFEIITNATNLTEEVLSAMKYNCSIINLSRAHYDDDMNQKLMNLNVKPTNEQLRFAYDYITNNFICNKITSISCMMMKNGIHTVDEIKKYIETYKYLNPNIIFFRQMEDISFYVDNKEEINNIMWRVEWMLDELKADKDLKFGSKEEVAGKGAVYIFKYKDYDFDVLFTVRPDMHILSEGAFKDEILRRVIMLPSGNIAIK